MACKITIDSVVAVRLPGGVGNSISGVQVSGTATNLAAGGTEVELLIIGPISPQGSPCQCFTGLVQTNDPFLCAAQHIPVVNGNWQVFLKARLIDPASSFCKCDDLSLQLEAADPNDSSCTATWGPSVVQCPTCPSVVVDPPLVGNCLNGVRSTTFTIHVTPSTTQTYVFFWAFGDGNNSPPIVILPNGAGTQTITYSYMPGTYTATLKTSDPVGCPDVSVNVIVPACEPCVAFTDITFAEGACDLQGNRSVTATANGGPPDVPKWQWDNVGLPQYSVPPDAPNQSTRIFPGGTSHVATVVVDTPSCFETLQATHDVGACACPTATSLAASPPSGSAPLPVTFAAVIANSAAQVGSPTFSYGDGSPPDTTGAHTYSSPGTYIAKVTVSGSPPCMPSSASTTVTVTGSVPCRRLCQFLCDGLLGLALILLVWASVAFIVIFCTGAATPQAIGAAAALAAVGLGLLALWGALCARFFCKVLNALSWIFSIIVAACAAVGLILAIYSWITGRPQPCLVGWFADAGVWGVALSVVGWISKISGCKIFQ